MAIIISFAMKLISPANAAEYHWPLRSLTLGHALSPAAFAPLMIATDMLMILEAREVIEGIETAMRHAIGVITFISF